MIFSFPFSFTVSVFWKYFLREASAHIEKLLIKLRNRPYYIKTVINICFKLVF